MQDYRNIQVWRQAHAIALGVYELTKSFPPEERYGIIQQMRRAAVSVAANIAEGSKKIFRRDYVRFLNMAECSLREVEYFLLLAHDLRFGDQDSLDRLRRSGNDGADADEVPPRHPECRPQIAIEAPDPRLPTRPLTPDAQSLLTVLALHRAPRQHPPIEVRNLVEPIRFEDRAGLRGAAARAAHGDDRPVLRELGDARSEVAEGNQL